MAPVPDPGPSGKVKEAPVAFSWCRGWGGVRRVVGGQRKMERSRRKVGDGGPIVNWPTERDGTDLWHVGWVLTPVPSPVNATWISWSWVRSGYKQLLCKQRRGGGGE